MTTVSGDNVLELLAQIARLERERDMLRVALKGLSDMYTRTWDRVDGALVMMPDSVPRFEEAHRAAFIALGEPVYEISEPSPPHPKTDS